MIDPLAYCLVGAGLLLAGWCGVQAYRKLPTNDPLMVAAILLELALLVQTGLGIWRLGAAHLAEPVTFLAYAIGILLPLPLGFFLARIERTNWGSMTLAISALVVGVMTLRLLQIWRSDFA